jgi:hypothetical protein
MDTEMLLNMLAKKEVLAQGDEAHNLICVREQLYDGNWNKYYNACHLHALYFGANPSVFKIPPNTDNTRYEAYLEVIVMMLSNLGFVCDPHTSLEQNRKLIIK